MGTFLHEVRTNYCKKLLFVVSLQKKSSTRQFESKAFIALVCIFFAPSTNESAQEASQEASITTKGGHNRRPTPVIY